MAKTNFSPTFPMFPGDAAAVTPSDASDLPTPSVIYVGNYGTTGAVKVTTAQGTDVTFLGVPAGFVIPVQVRRVWSTGTTATNLIRIF
jgi:hypothetical protein